MARDIAAAVLKRDETDIICLYGDLGSGKTTFAAGFGSVVLPRQRIVSPTFIIMKKYPLPAGHRNFYHIDLYRLTESQLPDLGLTEIFTEPSAIILVEWAERLGKLLPADRTDIRFEILSESGRRIEIMKVKGQKSKVKS